MGVMMQDARAEEAIRSGSVQQLVAALAEGANPDRVLESGYPLIHAATDKNDALLVGVLLRMGANPIAQDALGDTALHLAAEKNFTGARSSC